MVEGLFTHNVPLLPDRLAFPEHLPKGLNEQYLYQTEAELFLALKECLTQPKKRNFPIEISDFVARYDWRNLAPVYDARFKALMTQ